MKNKNLFAYVKDHVQHFGFFPADYEDIQTEKIIEYPNYMKLFSSKQTKELSRIFNNFESN